jgi:hypothetical protein
MYTACAQPERYTIYHFSYFIFNISKNFSLEIQIWHSVMKVSIVLMHAHWYITLSDIKCSVCCHCINHTCLNIYRTTISLNHCVCVQSVRLARVCEKFSYDNISVVNRKKVRFNKSSFFITYI